MRAPVLVLAVPLLAGCCAGVLLVDQTPQHLIAGTAAAAAMCAVAGLGFFTERSSSGLLCATALGAALAGYSSGASTTRGLYAPPLLAWFEEHPAEEPAILAGRMREDAAMAAGALLLTIDTTAVCSASGVCAAVNGGVRLSVGGTPMEARTREWRAGRDVRVTAVLRLPATFYNPGRSEDLRALARRGIILVGTIKSAALVEVTRRGGVVEESAAAVRDQVRRVLFRRVSPLDPRSAAVATAILIGERSSLSDEDERRLQDAGTYHVIAISGGNVAILTALLMGVARAARVPSRAAAGATILALLFYGEIAGGTASVGRAVTAAVILLSAVVLDHRGRTLNVLASVAVIAVAIAPSAVLDAGFLLSFGATTGIVLGVPAVLQLMPSPWAGTGRLWRVGARAAGGVLAATLCAELALLPITTSLFGRATVAGLVLNFAAIPLMSVVQCGSIVLLVLERFDRVSALAATVVHRAAQGLVDSARLIDAAPWLARDVSPPVWWLCAVYYGLAALALYGRRPRGGVVAFAVPAALVFFSPAATSRGLADPPAPGVLRVVVLDVGQGDATVAVLPDGRALLVDAGGLAGTAFDIGGRVVLPALRALRVRRLHAMVITHGDPDHLTGAETVLRRLHPAYVWEGVAVPRHEPLRRLAARAASDAVIWRTVRPGDVDRVGGMEIRVHHPPEPAWERQRVRNDDSVVLELRHGEVSILLPGDIGAEAEAVLLPALALGRIVVLKAAHHGSATSSGEAFLDATTPRVVIFSTGRNNRFGHPARSVVERFRRRGTPMFNTAEDGAVFIETDGRSADVRGWHSGRRLLVVREDAGVQHGGTK